MKALHCICLGLLLLPALVRAEAIPEIDKGLEGKPFQDKLGRLRYLVYLSSGFFFDTNVFLKQRDAKWAFGWFVVPGFRGHVPVLEDRLDVHLDYQGRARLYAGEGGTDLANHMEQQFLIRVPYRPGKLWVWDFTEAAAFLTDPLDAQIPRAERFINDLNLTALYKAKYADYRGTIRHNLVRYTSTTFNFLEYDNYGMNAEIEYRELGPTIRLLGELRLDAFDYVQEFRNDQLINALLFGVASSFGENKAWIYSAKIGGSHGMVTKKATNFTRDTSQFGFVAEIKAKWKKEKNPSFLEGSLRSTLDTSTASNFSQVYEANASGLYSLNPKLSWSGLLKFQMVERLDLNRDLALLVLQNSITWSPYDVIRNLDVFGRLEYRRQFSSVRIDRYEVFRVFVGATYVF